MNFKHKREKPFHILGTLSTSGNSTNRPHIVAFNKKYTVFVTPLPIPPSHQGGASGRCETLYWDSLPAFSDIGGPKSYNRIKISYIKIQNKTTIVVVFIVSYTYNPESYLYIQKLYITFT